MVDFVRGLPRVGHDPPLLARRPSPSLPPSGFPSPCCWRATALPSLGASAPFGVSALRKRGR
eukprot:8605909-Alexandrium_andersonii.AAC.1